MRYFRFGLVLLALQASVGFAATDTDTALSMYPDALVTEFQRLCDDGEQLQKEVGTARIGDYVIAAYSNRFSGFVRVLSTAGPAPTIVEEVNTSVLKMDGSHPTVRLVDLDGDGKPEVIIRYQSMRYVQDWIFRFANGHLTSVSPLNQRDGVAFSRALDATYADIDGDGQLELIIPPRPRTTEQDTTVFHLTPQGYTTTVATKILTTIPLARTTGEPDEFETSFFAPASTQVLVRIINGDADGKNAVTSATVSINGRQVFAPSDFKQHQHVIESTITAAANNTVVVTLDSAPGSRLLLIVAQK